MIKLNTISGVAQHLLVAAALAISLTVSAADQGRGAPGGFHSTTAAPNMPDECVAYPERCKSNAVERQNSNEANAKIPIASPAHTYCVCCAKGGPYTVAATALPSYDFANSCRSHNAGSVLYVAKIGIMACTCKGVSGPAKDIQKYVK